MAQAPRPFEGFWLLSLFFFRRPVRVVAPFAAPVVGDDRKTRLATCLPVARGPEAYHNPSHVVPIWVCHHDRPAATCKPWLIETHLPQNRAIQSIAVDPLVRLHLPCTCINDVPVETAAGTACRRNIMRIHGGENFFPGSYLHVPL